MKKPFSFFYIIFFIVAIYFVIRYTDFQQTPVKHETIPTEKISMKITSPAFGNNQRLPARYTCNGEGINPPLKFSGVPPETQSLVLIADDPDAVSGTWVHWIIYNIDPSVREVSENSVPASGIQGSNSSGKPNYGSPCPPSGTHRYFFKLYALNKTLTIQGEANMETIQNAMKNSIISQAELIGLYSQQK